MNLYNEFLLLNTDAASNSSNASLIQKITGSESISTFTNPLALEDYIRCNFINKTDIRSAFVLLSLNLENEADWSLIDLYRRLNVEANSQLMIYLLADVISEENKERLMKANCVEGFMENPLTEDKLMGLMYYLYAN